MQDRQYQVVHIDNIVEAIEFHRTVVAQLPTGGGKTVEFSMIIKKYLHKLIEIQPGPTLILVHREELLKQSAKAVREILGFEPCLITSETSRFWLSRCYIGMVESTLQRLHMIVHPSLIIIDECHLQNFNKVHKQFPTTKIIGFSATPLSVSKKEPLKKYYETIITGPSIKQLINWGFLSQNLTRAPKNSVNPNNFAFDRLKNDYNEKQMSNVYSMANNVTNCVDKYFEYCLGKKTLVFNVSIEHSKIVTSCFVACGYNARHLDSDANKRPSKDPRCKNEREEIFLWFKETKDAILCSVMIPTMGFDEPTVQAIMLNFSTMSLVKFIQCCGRGSRIIDEYFLEKFQIDYPYQLTTKKYFDIIDMGQNWMRFGDWNDERDWKYIFENPDEPGQGIAPVKTCPSCEALVHAAARVCPFCGHEFEKKKVVQQDMEELILITKNINIEELTEKSEKKYKYYGMLELANDVVNNMFLMHGKDPSQMIVNRFFRMYYGLCIEWHKRTLSGKENELEDIKDSGWHIKKAKNNFNTLILRKNNANAIIEGDIPYDLVKYNEEEYDQQKKEIESNWKKYKSANWA